MVLHLPLRCLAGSFMSSSSPEGELELELELIQSHMTQKPMLRGEVGACRITQLTGTAKKQQNAL